MTALCQQRTACNRSIWQHCATAQFARQTACRFERAVTQLAQFLRSEARAIKKLIDPKDIAALAVFLASDAAKTISGQNLPIDADMQRN